MATRKKRPTRASSRDSEVLEADGAIVSVRFGSITKAFPARTKISEALAQTAREAGLTTYRAAGQDGSMITKGMAQRTFKAAGITSVEIQQLDKAGVT